MFSLICWINGWVHNRDAGDWRRPRAHYDVTVMNFLSFSTLRCRPVNRESPVRQSQYIGYTGDNARQKPVHYQPWYWASFSGIFWFGGVEGFLSILFQEFSNYINGRSTSASIMIRLQNVMAWRRFPHYWPFVTRIHQWPVGNASIAELWCFGFVFSSCWSNNRFPGDL